MSFEPGPLFVSLIAGVVGCALLIYGRKAGRVPHIVGGALFCLYPYFCSTMTSLIVGGLAIGAAVWFAVRQGW
jgi:hypothetical protein